MNLRGLFSSIALRRGFPLRQVLRKLTMDESLRVDSVRGLACLFLVAWHVTGEGLQNGLRIGDGPVRNFADAMSLIRMPLFTFLSGIVYASRPYDGDAWRFVRGKVRRLWLPLLTIGTAYLLIHSLANGQLNAVRFDWMSLHIRPVAKYWFIEGLFLVFMAIALMERLKLLDTIPRLLLMQLAFIEVSSFNIPVPYFGIHGLFFLMPFFLLGLAYRRFDLASQIGRPMGMLSFAFAVLVPLAYTPEWLELPDSGTWLNTGIGLVSCVGMMSIGIRSRVLATIGVYSYTIYLTHVFFTSPARSIATKLGITSLPILLVTGVMAGIAGAIVFDRLVSRHRLAAAILLGKSGTSRRTVVASAPSASTA